MTVLDEIVAHKAEEVRRRRDDLPVKAFPPRPGGVRDFAGALGRPGLQVIAEVKRKSPSKGDILLDADPADLGLPLASLDDLKGGTPEENAQMAVEILNGEPGPKRDIVVLNAAAGLMVGGVAADLHEGIALAGESTDSGRALTVLEKLVAF